MGTLGTHLLHLAPPLIAALLHSLWQAALLAAVGRLALLLVPFRRPNWRYGIALACLGATALLFLVTWRLEMQPTPAAASPAVPPPVAAVAPSPAVPFATAPSPIPPSAWREPPPSSAPSWQAVLGLLWLAGVLLMVFRAARILGGETRLARNAVPLADARHLALLEELRSRLGIARRVAVATVETMGSPAVVGMVSPVILIPAALLTGSTPETLRAILSHELAHIRRWDVLVNLFQLLVESLFFFNPCVWLLSAQIRKEREACCDAIAADCCGGGAAYARILVDVGQLVLTGSAAVPFAGHHGLSDRVRRLLGLRPTGETWRLPPLSVVLALLAGLAGLMAVAQGTFKATDAVLSAKERLDLIEQTVANQKTAEAAQVGTTRYCGHVTTADLAPLPKNVIFTQLTREPGSSTHTGLNLDSQTGHFESDATGTSAIFWLCVPGYTPCFAGPMTLGPEPVTDLGEWVLIPETPLPIRVLDDRDQPVANAKVQPYWDLAANTMFNGHSQTTDTQGQCEVPLVTECPMSLTIGAPGFEPAKFAELNPQDDTPLVLHLTPALPLVLKVLDQRTGLPVTGARVRELAGLTPIMSCTYSQDNALLLGTTTPDGTCTISDCHRDGAYWLLVEAPGYGIELVEHAQAGEQREVRLGEPRTITGTVTGNLGELSSGRDGPSVSFGYSVKWADCNYVSTWTKVPVQIANGVGTFRTDALWAGAFRLGVGKRSLRIDTRTGDTNLAIELAETVQAPPNLREIRMVLVPKPGTPLPRGTVRVNYQSPPETYYQEHDLPVVDGVVALSVPVGSHVTYTPTGAIGGWFPAGNVMFVPAGDDPLTISLPCIPAGAISVAVFEADDTPADGFMVSLQELAGSRHRTGGSLGVEGKNTASGGDGIHAFTATPLPLGGTYELVVHRGSTYVTTGPVGLTEAHPLHQQRLVLSGDATVTGRVVDAAGNPVPKLVVTLSLKLNRGSFGTSGPETDEEGRFAFPGVVRHAAAQYQVSVSPKRDFTPARVPVTDLDQPLRVVVQPGLTVSGQILDKDSGAPLPEREVWLWRETGPGQDYRQFQPEGPTGRDGSFRFSNLLPGTYQLRCNQVPGNTNEAPSVTAGQTEPVVWRVSVQD